MNRKTDNLTNRRGKSTWRLMSTETIKLVRDGENGVWRWGEREIIYLSLQCHHQNDSCIKMGSDERHFNVSLIVADKVTGQCPQTTTFLKRKESRSGFEPRSLCLPAYNALPLDRTGSQPDEKDCSNLTNPNASTSPA